MPFFLLTLQSRKELLELLSNTTRASHLSADHTVHHRTRSGSIAFTSTSNMPPGTLPGVAAALLQSRRGMDLNAAAAGAGSPTADGASTSSSSAVTSDDKGRPLNALHNAALGRDCSFDVRRRVARAPLTTAQSVYLEYLMMELNRAQAEIEEADAAPPSSASSPQRSFFDDPDASDVMAGADEVANELMRLVAKRNYRKDSFCFSASSLMYRAPAARELAVTDPASSVTKSAGTGSTTGLVPSNVPMNTAARVRESEAQMAVRFLVFVAMF